MKSRASLGRVPWWRRSLAEAAVWLVLWPMNLALAQCPPIFPPPGCQMEFEPNNEIWLATPWMVDQPLCGTQNLATGSDFFRLEGLPPELGVTIQVQPDTFNPLLRLWTLDNGSPLLLGTSDASGWCQVEQISGRSWDPCQPFVMVNGLYLEVAQSPLTMPSSGSWMAFAAVLPTGVPMGDCCQYPIGAGPFPFTDTRNTAVDYRDMGFGASPDVWYRLDLPSAGILTAQTCGGSTAFDTVLRLVDEDCTTVLDMNDNSVRCGAGSTRSWLRKAVSAGAYYLVVEGAGSASGIFQLDVDFTTCAGISPDPGMLFEMEPNDLWSMAQPWPVELGLFGEQTPLGDSDWFMLTGVRPGELVQLSVQPDSFDPVLRVYGLEAGSPVLLAQSDGGAFCEAEQVLVGGWDPCTVLVPIDALLVEIACSPATLPSSGNYSASALVVAPGVPQGDCCQYPISVGGFPFSDSQNSGVAFRDMGFGPAPDVWYRIQLEQAGLLTAQTCGGGTTFDTVLRVVDDDCATVIAQNDNSVACGVGSLQSWLSTCLAAGTYYVVVEGASGASGSFALSLALRPNAGAPSLMAGNWGRLAEEWHQHVGPGPTTLRLLADDACGCLSQVSFFVRLPMGPYLPLGVDTDGREAFIATQHVMTADAGGWSVQVDPSLLRQDPGPLHFSAELLGEDGSLSVVELESWYAPNLEEEALVEGLEHVEVVHGESYLVQPADALLPATSVGWEVTEKALEWSRAVPAVNQRGVSDTHCAPAAAAACLEWLDATYGSNVTGGLSGDALTQALGVYMGTNSDPANPGTSQSNMTSGLQGWIDDHGGGYTVHTEDPATPAEMQNQGEAQGQDVILVLEWADGGAHAVTLSSIHNLPQEDGTVLMDFMDPWTGSTQWGSFNPATGGFSGYGDAGDGGSTGMATYVCPTSSAPSPSRTTWQPFTGPLPVPVPMGHSWLKLTFMDPYGKVTELFSIVERRPAEAPMVSLTYEEEEGRVHLSWAPVRDAQAYRIYRNVDGYFNEDDMAPWLETTACEAWDECDSARWFYTVKTVYGQ